MAKKKYAAFALGKRIAHLRKKEGLSQLDLSLDSGIAKSYICELEAGKRNPSLLILERICVSLDVTLSTLFEGVGPVTSDSIKR